MKINVDVKELIEILEITPPNQNIMIVGDHGIGKSRILTEYYTKKNTPVITLFLGQMSDPGDLLGLPTTNENTGKTDFMPPYWFPTNNSPIVLFLDELNRARPEILQSVMDLTLNRKLAGRSLPEGSIIISAVNEGDKYQLTDLDPALVSRFNIYTFRPSVKDWLLWAQKSDIHPEVIRFIENNEIYLDGRIKEDSSDLEKIPDRRAWERVSDLLAQAKYINNTLKKAIAGIVGAEAGNRFFEELNNSKTIKGSDILINFKKSKKILEGKSIKEIILINDSILRFLEIKSETSKTQKQIWIKNAFDYIVWLTSQHHSREAAAHFIESLQKGEYPVASSFLLSEEPKIMEVINEFLQEL